MSDTSTSSKYCWDKFNDLGPQLWSISVFIKTMLCKQLYIWLNKDVWDQTVFDADMIFSAIIKPPHKYDTYYRLCWLQILLT